MSTHSLPASTEFTKARGGFSLLATLLYIALASMLLATLGTLTSMILNTNARARANHELAYATMFLQEYLLGVTRDAEEVLVPMAGNASPELQVVRTTTGILRVYLSEGRVWVTEGAGVPQALSPEGVVWDSFEFMRIERPGTLPYLAYAGHASFPDPTSPSGTMLEATTTLVWYPYHHEAE